MKKNYVLLGLMFVLLSSFASAVIDDAVSHWTLNETSGGILRDSNGYMDLNASANNITGVGKIGLINNSFNLSNLYSFKTNQSIDSKPLFNSSNFTYVLFYYGNSVTAGDVWIDGNWNCPAGGAGDGFQFDTNGGAEFRIIIGGSVYTFTGGLAKLNATTWNQVALTRTPAGMILYINGLQVATAGANSYAGLGGSGCRVTFGAYGRGDNRLNERMDEISYYNRQITASEVLDIFRNVSAGIPYPYVAGSPPPPPSGNLSDISFQTGTTVNNSVLVYPNAVISINTSAVNFGVIPTTNHSIYNLTGALLYRMSNVSNNTFNSFNNLTPRVYYFNATAYNLTTKNNTETRIVTVISNQSIVIGSNSILNNSVRYYVGNNFTYNVTTLFFNNATINITINIYNSTGLVQSNSRRGNTSFNMSYSGLGVGTYYINATATDLVVSNRTETRVFYIYNLSSGLFINPVSEQKVNRSLNITWSKSVSNPDVVPILNYTIQLLNRSGSLLFNLSNSVLNFTFWNTYQYNLSIENYTLRLITIDNNSKTTSTDQNINITRNTLLNITAKSIGGINISSFTINAYNAEYDLNITLNTTNGYLEIDHIRGNISINIDAESYSINENTSFAILNVLSQNHSYQFTLYQTNTINFTFYNQSGNTVMTSNVTFDLIGSLSSYTNMTTNGNIVLSLITPDSYNMRYSAVGFSTRFYTLTVLNRSYQNLNLYLISSSLASNISVFVVDEVLNPVEGAYVKALKYDLATNTYILQEIGVTDSSGKTIMTLSKNTEYYKFIVEYPSGTVELTTTPAYITTDSLTLQISFDTPFGEEFFNYDSLSGTVTFNTLTNNFNYNYNDASGVGTNYCLYIYEGVNSSQRLINTSCSTSATGTILIGVDPTAGKSYYALATYFENGVEKFFGSASYQFAKTLVINNYGLFLQILITLAVAATAIASPSLALILTPISLLFGRLMEFHQLSYGIIVVLTFLGMMIAYLISQRKN